MSTHETLPDPTTLIAELDGGTHADRMRRMGLLGRDHATDPALGPLLDAVGAVSATHRILTIPAAVAAGDDECLRALSADRDPRVRASLGARLVLPADPGPELLAASVRERARLVRRIRTARDVDAEARADRAARVLRTAFGPQAAVGVLPACGRATVEATLDEVVVAPADLERLAARHPDLAAARLAEELPTADEHWTGFRDALGALALRDPLAVLDLVDRFASEPGLPRAIDRLLPTLLRAAPERVVGRLAEPAAWRNRNRIPLALRRRAPGVDDGMRDRIAAAIAAGAPRLLATWLRAEPVPRRGDVLRAIDVHPSFGADGFFDVLDALPATEREAITSRLLEGEVTTTRETFTEAFARLPLAEARRRLDPLREVADARERADGWTGLATAARLHGGSALDDLLAEVVARTARERDAVRERILSALVPIRPDEWTAERLGRLATIATHAADAIDTGESTRLHLLRIVVGVLAHAATRHDADRLAIAESELVRLTRAFGPRSVPGIVPMLPATTDPILWRTLEPLLAAETPQDRAAVAVAFAGALGSRARVLDGLQGLLEHAALHGDRRTAAPAIDRWLDDPSTRGERVARLLHVDPSAVLLPVVAAVVSGVRQDLLDGVIADPPRTGRFVDDGDAPAPLLTRPGRWLPRQHRAYAALLTDDLDRRAGSAAGVRERLDALAALPDVGFPALEHRLTASDDRVLATRVGLALSRSDRPAAAFALLLAACRRDEHPLPVAVLAACSRAVPRDEIGPLLDDALGAADTGVGLRRSLVRLLLVTAPDGAIDRIASIAVDDDAHRDVRIAATAALATRLDAEEAWRALDAVAAVAVGGDDDEEDWDEDEDEDEDDWDEDSDEDDEDDDDDDWDEDDEDDEDWDEDGDDWDDENSDGEDDDAVDDEDDWDDDAPTTGDPHRVDAARSLMALSPDVVPPNRRARLAALLSGVVADAGPRVRDAVAPAFTAWVPLDAVAARTAADAVADLDATGGWAALAEGLAEGIRTRAVHDELPRLVDRLASAHPAPVPARDLPATQRLRDLTDFLCAEDAARVAPDVVRVLAERLAPCEPTLSARLRIELTRADPSTPDGIDALVREVADRPMLAATIASDLQRDEWGGPVDPFPSAGTIARRLVEDAPDEPVAAVLALAVLRTVEEGELRPAEQDLVRSLREHADPSVAELARTLPLRPE